MAAIDDKISALQFSVTTTKTPEEVFRLVSDAASVAQGEKIVLTRQADTLVTGVARNFVRVQHAAFSVSATAGAEGSTTVTLAIGDYLRTRQTVVLIPVSPWSAPAYKALREFSAYLRDRL